MYWAGAGGGRSTDRPSRENDVTIVLFAPFGHLHAQFTLAVVGEGGGGELTCVTLATDKQSLIYMSVVRLQTFRNDIYCTQHAFIIYKNVNI